MNPSIPLNQRPRINKYFERKRILERKVLFCLDLFRSVAEEKGDGEKLFFHRQLETWRGPSKSILHLFHDRLLALSFDFFS